MSVSTAPSIPDGRLDAETTRLALQAQAGSAAAFCALIDLHERAARRVAVAALGNVAEADEAVQEACITAWQRIAYLDDVGAFRAWLLRITWRKALDRRRSIRAWLKRFAGSTPPVVANVADRQRNVVEELLNEERDRVIARAIRSLPTRLRDPFMLAASGEHRYEEIASMLGIPVGTVKWRVSEARRVLREKLTRLGVGR
jgi:RNA polymerase sigma-70 factor (ECF subfamily)